MDDREKRPAEETDRKVDGGQVFGNAASLRKQHKEGKPKNRRWLTLAALVVVVALAVGGVYLSRIIVPKVPESEPGTTATTETLKLIDRTRADLKEVTVTQAGDSYTLTVLADGTYQLKGYPDFALNQTKAGNLAMSSTYMLYQSTIENPGDLATYGLQKPQAKVDITYTDGQKKTLLLGDKSPTGNRYYLMEQGKSDVYIVYSSTGTNFTVTRQGMHVATMPTLSTDMIKKASLTLKDGQTITVGYEAGRESLGISSLLLTSPIEYEADSERVTAYFEGIVGIKLKSFEVDAAADTLHLYGLDVPRYHLTVYGQDSSGNEAVGLELFIGNDKDTDSTYARIDGTNDVYLLDRASTSFLSGITAARLVDRFANIINIAKVDGIQVTGDGIDEKFVITRTPELDDQGNQKLNANNQPVNIEEFTINGEVMEDTTFRKLYQLIIGTRVDGMIPEDKVIGDDVKPVLTVKYQVNTIKDEEVVEYLPYDSDHYAVRRNGVCMFYILKTRVDSIPKALAEYHAGTFVPTAYGL